MASYTKVLVILRLKVVFSHNSYIEFDQLLQVCGWPSGTEIALCTPQRQISIQEENCLSSITIEWHLSTTSHSDDIR